MMSNNEQVKIDWSKIPEYQQKVFCRALIDACKKFYSDPKNVEKFEQWQAKRRKGERKEV